MTQKRRLVDGEWFIGPYRDCLNDMAWFDSLSAEARERHRRLVDIRACADQRAARDQVLRLLDANEKTDARRKKSASRRRKVPGAPKL